MDSVELCQIAMIDFFVMPPCTPLRWKILHMFEAVFAADNIDMFPTFTSKYNYFMQKKSLLISQA